MIFVFNLTNIIGDNQPAFNLSIAGLVQLILHNVPSQMLKKFNLVLTIIIKTNVYRNVFNKVAMCFMGKEKNNRTKKTVKGRG